MRRELGDITDEQWETIKDTTRNYPWAHAFQVYSKTSTVAIIIYDQPELGAGYIEVDSFKIDENGRYS